MACEHVESLSFQHVPHTDRAITVAAEQQAACTHDKRMLKQASQLRQYMISTLLTAEREVDRVTTKKYAFLFIAANFPIGSQVKQSTLKRKKHNATWFFKTQDFSIRIKMFRYLLMHRRNRFQRRRHSGRSVHFSPQTRDLRNAAHNFRFVCPRSSPFYRRSAQP